MAVNISIELLKKRGLFYYKNNLEGSVTKGREKQ